MKIVSENVKDVIALSPMQESMLFIYLTDIEHEKYIAQCCYKFTGDIDLNYFMESWKSVVNNNDVLRTVFRWERLKQPIQIVLKEFYPDIEVIDLEHEKIDSMENKIISEMEQERKRKFDISEVCYRIKLYKVSNYEIYMLISSFAIIYDGWSNSIMLREFIDTYNNLYDGVIEQYKKRRSYKEFIIWMKKQNEEKYKEFWTNNLNGYHSNYMLSQNDTEEKKSDSKCKSFQFKIPKELEQELKVYFNEEKVTLADLVYTLWGLWLYKSERIKDIAFGVIVSGRPVELEGIDNVMGVFINTVLLRIQIDKYVTFHDLIVYVHSFMITLKEYENYSLAKIKSCSSGGGSDSLFNTIVVLQNYPIDSSSCGHLNFELFQSYDHTDFKIAVGVLVWKDILFDIRYSDSVEKEELIEFKEFALEMLKKIGKKELNELQLSSLIEENSFESDEFLNDLKEMELFDEIL